MKFRKKPIIVEAQQWFPTNDFEIEGVIIDHVLIAGHLVKNAKIITLEGEMWVSPGDWIITGINGEKYPCKRDIFEKTYDRVDE